MVFTGPFCTFTMSGMPLSTLVVRIDSELGAPVIDKTGLTGPLDAALEFESSRPTQVTPEVAPLLEFFQAVPLAFALQRQLGLKLDEVKAPLEIVVIEAAQRPTPD